MNKKRRSFYPQVAIANRGGWLEPKKCRTKYTDYTKSLEVSLGDVEIYNWSAHKEVMYLHKRSDGGEPVSSSHHWIEAE